MEIEHVYYKGTGLNSSHVGKQELENWNKTVKNECGGKGGKGGKGVQCSVNLKG